MAQTCLMIEVLTMDGHLHPITRSAPLGGNSAVVHGCKTRGKSGVSFALAE
jgi:hypothetical protein